jgi:hypothetical protein
VKISFWNLRSENSKNRDQRQNEEGGEWEEKDELHKCRTVFSFFANEFEFTLNTTTRSISEKTQERRRENKNEKTRIKSRCGIMESKSEGCKVSVWMAEKLFRQQSDKRCCSFIRTTRKEKRGNEKAGPTEGRNKLFALFENIHFQAAVEVLEFIAFFFTAAASRSRGRVSFC